MDGFAIVKLTDVVKAKDDGHQDQEESSEKEDKLRQKEEEANMTKLVSDCGSLIAAALVDNPCYTHLLPADKEREWRQNALDWLFTANIKLVMGLGLSPLVSLNPDTNEIIGFVMLKPSNLEPSFQDKMKGGYPLLPFKCGWRSLPKMMKMMDWMDKKMAAVTNGRQYMELQRMTVRPAYQGQGIGSRLLAEALARDVDPVALPCVLVTQELRNVTFYKRHGFEVADEDIYPPLPVVSDSSTSGTKNSSSTSTSSLTSSSSSNKKKKSGQKEDVFCINDEIYEGYFNNWILIREPRTDVATAAAAAAAANNGVDDDGAAAASASDVDVGAVDGGG